MSISFQAEWLGPRVGGRPVLFRIITWTS